MMKNSVNGGMMNAPAPTKESGLLTSGNKTKEPVVANPKKEKLAVALPLTPDKTESDENVESEARDVRAFPVVGIGASAGGLEAFTQLLEELPADTPPPHHNASESSY